MSKHYYSLPLEVIHKDNKHYYSNGCSCFEEGKDRCEGHEAVNEIKEGYILSTGAGTLKLYTCTDHDMFWPVGAASIVIAYSEEEARGLLQEALNEHGLDGTKEFTLVEIRYYPRAVILVDGNY